MSDHAGSATDRQGDYQALLEELDRYVQAIRLAALELKAAAGGIQAVERNVDRLLASAKMLEINISDALGRDRTMASWTEDDSRL
jgi:hypothetical protein